MSSVDEVFEIQESEYEAFDKFDFDDKLIGDIGSVSNNKYIEAAYQSIVRLDKIRDGLTSTD